MKINLGLYLSVILFSLSSMAKEEEHSHDFTENVSAFHDVMAPLWHADSSMERIKSTCEAVEKMQVLASRIDGANTLIKSLLALSSNCDKELKVFDAAFLQVHHAFHKVTDESKQK